MKIDLSQAITPEHKQQSRRAVLLKRVSLRRDLAIEAGVTVDGVAVQTDNLSQQRIMGAALQAIIDPDVVQVWRGRPGSAQVTGPGILTIAQAVRAHVQACFTREAELFDAINAGGDPDIETGWPG